MKQSQQVIKVMEDNGGYATLGYLYQNVNVKDWKTKTPFASIRRIVQDDRYFFKIRPGLWALNDYREKVLRKFDLATSDKRREDIFNHTYYQGLIVEIGNLKDFQTHVANQDKNKLFLERPLKEVSSLEETYEFSYSTTVRLVNNIDVVWFNRRRMPHSFFEVEHSTQIQNSLLKFVELQDFNARMLIVAPKQRRAEFEQKKQFEAFREIRGRLLFLDYDSLVKQYENLMEKSQEAVIL